MKPFKHRMATGCLALLLAAQMAGCASGVDDAARKDAARQRLTSAVALFKERCKSAGERIDRTVDGVEGLFLMKIRPKGINYGNQFILDDPYGRDFRGEAYIESFLRDFYRGASVNPPWAPLPRGYQWVETTDVATGKVYRFTAKYNNVLIKPRPIDPNAGHEYFVEKFVLERESMPALSARYGVTYDDISTIEDRTHWIAGSSLKVIDLQTSEAIAERIGYMIDLGQGNNSGGRAAWLLAASHACPKFVGGNAASDQAGQAVRFAHGVLSPKVEK